MANVPVNAGGNLQAALDAATPGTVVQLEAGATFQGPFTLRGSDVTLTSATTLPAPGTRCLPSHAKGFAKIRARSESALLHRGAVVKQTLVGIEVIGDPDSNAATVEFMPESVQIVIDRCFLHGDGARGAKRGVGMNSTGMKVTNSSVLDFKRVGQDAQAIFAAFGPGPYLVENCWLEASGENIMIGGSDPTIPNLIPSDIVVRRNLLRKPLVWHNRVGAQWQVKNLFELKNAQRVLVEENVMEGNWLSAQVGFAVVLTVRDQDGTAPWCTIRDVIVRNNVVRDSSAFLSVLGLDDEERASVRMQNVQVYNNLAYRIDHALYGGSDKSVQVIASPRNLSITNNTILSNNDGSFLFLSPDDTVAQGFAFQRNIVYEGDYGIVGNGTAVGLPSWQAGVDATSRFDGNVIRRGTSGRTLSYPGSNAMGDVVLGADLKLLPQFGTAAGADIDALRRVAQRAGGLTL